jgi:hypothetical protein
MQLTSTDGSQVFRSSAVNRAIQFQVAVNAKTFDTLIAKLYSNPIQAVIRELSTNAYEAHQMTNTEHIPFDVHLPTALKPTFIIRDYGPGLSETDIVDIYTILNKSTKDQSNDMGGAFGLGSKSPFSYSGTFNVTSYHNGMKYVYAACRNSDGIPEFNPLSSGPSSEPSGVQISIPVKSHDIHAFTKEAIRVYEFFKTKPNVTGGVSYALGGLTIKAKGKNWALYSHPTMNQSLAVMGNIAYPLETMFGYHDVYANNLLFYFEIGEVEPTPSREALSLTDDVKDMIKKRCEEYRLSIEKEISQQLDKENTKFLASIRCRELTSNIRVSIHPTYKGNKISTRENITLPFEYSTISGRNKFTRSSIKSKVIAASDDYVFIIDDGQQYFNKKLDEHCENNYSLRSSIIYHGIIVDSANEQTLIDELGVDSSKFIRMSDLVMKIVAKAPKKPRNVLTVNKILYPESKNYSFDAEKTLTDTDLGYYVYTKHSRAIINNFVLTKEQFSQIYGMLNNLNIIKDTDIVYSIKGKADTKKLVDFETLTIGKYKDYADMAIQKNLSVQIYHELSRYNTLSYKMLEILDSGIDVKKIIDTDLLTLLKELEVVRDNASTASSSSYTYSVNLNPIKLGLSVLEDIYDVDTAQEIDIYDAKELNKTVSAFETKSGNIINKYPILKHLSAHSVKSLGVNEINRYLKS